MDEELKAAVLKIAAALDGTKDAIEKAPASMSRQTSREQSYSASSTANVVNNAAANAIGAIDSQAGTMRLLSSVPVVGGTAAAAASQVFGGAAYHYQQSVPYQKAEEYATAAGQAGVMLSEKEGLQIRDYYRRQGEITAHNVQLVQQQNAPIPALIQLKENLSDAARMATQDPGTFWEAYKENWDAGVIGPTSKAQRRAFPPAALEAIDHAFDENRQLHHKEYEGK